MKENKIIVKTRKDFIDVYRKVFIPSCHRLGISFDYRKDINSWTTFWCLVDDDKYLVVELDEIV